tara:strand:+ start:11492 stop:12652 length:1161 start_codon:yes stop_codon:yes gene_type:complete
MKTIKQLAVPQDTDLVKFPQGTIKNQTSSELGTPVVREVYGDILTNMYALLADVGIVPDGLEDNNTKGYQLLEAFKKLANVLNDVEQVMTLAGTVWSVNFKIDNLPDKYVFIGRATEDYNDAISYTFKGTDINSYTLTSPTGFKASDDVLVIIDKSGVRVIGLTQSQSEEDVYTVFGTPVVFNDSSKMYYEEEGNLLTDVPSVNYLQAIIRVAEGNGTLLVYNMMVMQGHVLCFCYLPDVQTYKFYQFDLNDLATAELVTILEIVIPTGSNNEPYVYTDGTLVYMTNQAGTTANDYELAGLTYNAVAKTLNFDISRSLDPAFSKTTNGVIQGSELVTFMAGELKKYNLATGIETILGTYNTFVGTLFRFNGGTYYSNGEVAKKWTV